MALLLVPTLRGERSLIGRDLLAETELNIGQWGGLLELAYELLAPSPESIDATATTSESVPTVVLLTSETAGLGSGHVDRLSARVVAAAHAQGLSVVTSHWDGARGEETLADLARRLGRVADGIVTVGLSYDQVGPLADTADIPVWNAGSDRWSPLQLLGDLVTMMEYAGSPPRRLCAAYVGSAGTATANSLVIAGAMLGMEVWLVASQAPSETDDVEVAARGIGARTGARLVHTDSLDRARAACHFVYRGDLLEAGGALEPTGEALQERREENAILAVRAAFVASLGLAYPGL